MEIKEPGMRKKSLVFRFVSLQIVCLCIMTSFGSFAIAYLKDVRGVSDGTVGTLLMLMTIGAFTGNFLFGRLCDYFHTHKRVFFLSCALIVPTGMALYASPNITAIYVLYILFGFVQAPIAVVLDTWIIGTFTGNPGVYGKIRAAGALSYAVSSVVYGRLLNTYGYGIIPFALGGTVLVGVLIASTIPDSREAIQPKSEGRGSAKRLLNAPLVLFLACLLMTGTCGSVYQFLPVMMGRVGGSLGTLGLALSSSGVAQMPFMFFSDRLRHIPPRVRISISGMIYIVMSLCFAFGPSPAFLVAGALISGGAYGLLLPATRELVGELSPPEMRTTAQGLADSVFLSLSGIVSSGTIGALSGSLGMRGVILGIATMQAVGVILLLILHKRSRANCHMQVKCETVA